MFPTVSRPALLLGLFIMMGFLSHYAEATEFDPEGYRSITLSEAQAKALQQNYSYQAKEAAYQAAKWSKNSAKAALYPSLSLDGAYLYMDPATVVRTGASSYTLNHDMRSYSFNLAQPLFLGGRLWQAYRISQTSEEIAALAMQSSRMQVISDVEAKYLAVLQLKDVYDLARRELNSSRNDLELADLKMQNGILSRVDHLRFKANVANKEVSLLQAATALQLAMKDFANYLAEPELLLPAPLNENEGESIISILADYDLTGTGELTAEAIKILEGRNLELQTLEKTVQLADRAYSVAKASFWPSLMLTGSREYSENGLDRYRFEGSTQVILSASLPLLPAVGNYASTRKAREEARKARLEVQTAGDGIKLGMQSAILNLVSTAKQVKSAELSQTYNEDLYAQLEERYRANMITANELLDAEAMLSAAQLARTNAFFSFLEARTALLKMLAWENNEQLNNMIINIRNTHER